MTKVFRRIEATAGGKGHYWILDVSDGEGYKRTRKRRPFAHKRKLEEESLASNVPIDVEGEEVEAGQMKEEDELSSEASEGG